jgi:hypothetical protein
VRAALLVVLAGCAHAAQPDVPPVQVQIEAHTADEQATAEQLRRLMREHDLRPWLYTKSIAIDENAIPHSHPVLTLHARHLHDDLLLLSTFIHEQGHWYVTQRQSQLDVAAAEWKARVPDLPVGFPDGAQSAESNYEHIAVIMLEWKGLKRLVGELAAMQAMQFWATDHYRAVYRWVIEHPGEVNDVMKKSGLLDKDGRPTPAPL